MFYPLDKKLRRCSQAQQLLHMQQAKLTHVQVHDKELKVVMIQNEVAKLTVDVLNTEAHNVQLGDTLKLLDDELVDKAKVIDKYQLEIQRRNDDVEKKTRNVDTLNRKLEKLLYDMEGEDTGARICTRMHCFVPIQREVKLFCSFL